MATISDVGVGVSEAGFPVIVLLRHDAIEPDHAPARMRNCLPSRCAGRHRGHANPPHDVEAEEGKAVAP